MVCSINAGWPIVYVEGSKVIFAKYYMSLSDIECVLVNSACPDEMPHNAKQKDSGLQRVELDKPCL